MSTTTIKRPRATADFKTLLAFLGGDDAKAVAAWNTANPDNMITDTSVDPLTPEARTLVNKGLLTEEAALAVLAGTDASAPANPVAPVEPPTSKELSDAAVTNAGFVHRKGRVYSNPTLIEAQVRVLKTGKPEIVAVEGSRITKAIQVFRTDDGSSVALQNLGETTE